jgi:large subunit ribosomal protein L4
VFKLNRKVKKLALCSALSARFQGEKLLVVKDLKMDTISSKSFAQTVTKLQVEGVLVVIDQADKNVELSARNLHNVKVLRAEGVNVYDILKYPNLVLTDAAVSEIEGALGK